jgi:hypothetical protein
MPAKNVLRSMRGNIIMCGGLVPCQGRGPYGSYRGFPVRSLFADIIFLAMRCPRDGRECRISGVSARPPVLLDFRSIDRFRYRVSDSRTVDLLAASRAAGSVWREKGNSSGGRNGFE